MNCLDLATVYAVLLMKWKYYTRRIALTADHLKLDRKLTKEFRLGKNTDLWSAKKLDRDIKKMQRSMRRWKRRIAQINRIKAPVERMLKSKNAATLSQRWIDGLWPKWMEKDGKTKLGPY